MVINANWRKLSVGDVVRCTSVNDEEVCEGIVETKMSLQADVDDERRERNRVRKVMAGRMFGGC
jgi:hypothetical protein